MEDNKDFETYLLLSHNKLSISVIKKKYEITYRQELILEENSKSFLEKLDFFLSKNIFKIEKILNNFVNNVFLILDFDEFFPIEISIKKKINSNNLEYILSSIKDYCKNTLENKKIIHMLISRYVIDNQTYSYLPKDFKDKVISLDVKFICVSKNSIKRYEEILKRYHITINQILSAPYIGEFLNGEHKDVSVMAKRIVDGYNPNEVTLITKNRKKQGFFEKFFHFFN